MKDIDFDELDRAVNSLMGAPGSASKSETISVNSLKSQDNPAQASSQVAPPVDRLSGSESNESHAITVSVKNTPAPTVVRRSGTRFMDMKPTAPSPIRPKAPSREGVAVPVRPTIIDEPVVEDISSETKVQSESTEPTPVVKPTTPDLPESVPVKYEPTTETEPDEPSQPANQGSESPFLSDAKVDKRPLNSQADYQAEAYDTFDSLIDSPQKNEQPTAQTETPDEYEADLAAIESESAPETEAEKSEASNATPVYERNESIARQYREQPSSGDQRHAAIYDASQYPEPLAHPAKNKQSWLWVLWVILLLALGAGGAVALYMLDLL